VSACEIIKRTKKGKAGMGQRGFWEVEEREAKIAQKQSLLLDEGKVIKFETIK
jgi:hypothetical protein